MSGERIFLVDAGKGGVVDLVRATDLVVRNAGLPVALIGGLAVTCRLAAAHRPTRDVDLVAETSPDLVAEAGTVSANLISGGIARAATDTASVRLFVGDTKVEIIETERLDEIESAGIEPERSRLFVVAHRWALESCTSVSISVTDTDVEVTAPVATATALVAMKLHSIQDRSEDRKRASDAWDLFRLLDARNTKGEITRTIARGPEGLASMVANALDQVFRIEVTRTRRWISGYGDPEWVRVMTDDALAALAAEVVDGLTP